MGHKCRDVEICGLLIMTSNGIQVWLPGAQSLLTEIGTLRPEAASLAAIPFHENSSIPAYRGSWS